MAGNLESPRSSKVSWVVFVGTFGLFAVALLVGVWLYLRPPGEHVGDLDLQAPASSLTLDLAPGDTLHFRAHVTVGTKGYPTSARSRSEALYERLRASAITVSDSGAGRAALATTCAAYDGKSMSSSGSSSEVSVGGIPITCTFAGIAAGRHVITAKVEWAKTADVRAATLEVRREPAKK